MTNAVFYEKSTGKNYTLSLEEAVKKCIEEMHSLYEKTLNELGEEQAKIFSAYEMLLSDQMLIMPIYQSIENGTEPARAAREETGKMADILASKGNEYMRQRADDIKYVGELLANAMLGSEAKYTLPENGEKFILAADELTPADTMQFEASRLAGLVTKKGGATSHTVILAKSLGIPAIIGVLNLSPFENTVGAIDGYTGEFVLNPDENTKNEYEQKIEDENILRQQIDKISANEAKTLDNTRIHVLGNIGTPLDISGFENDNFDGIGLFRSEFLYSAEDKKPTIEKQINEYKKAIDKIYPRPVTIRTLDVGGDKQIKYMNMTPEENPFLGNRGVRICLENPNIFKEQIEAILRAAEGKSVNIMIPLVTSLNEIIQTKALIDDVKNRLDSENIGHCKDFRLGIMIETPASAIMAEDYAKYCDFFSIGTNDLTQYIMCADRGNPAVEHVYNPFNPAVIRSIAKIINAGKAAGIDVSVCGDLAADLRFTKLLLGIGLKKFSVPLPMLGRIKYKISQINTKDAKKLADTVLKMSNEDEIKKILEEE